jgi:hypothetical protein
MRKISFGISPSGVVEVEYVDKNNTQGILRFDGDRLDLINKPTLPKHAPRTVLTYEGVPPSELVSKSGKCTYVFKDGKAADHPMVSVFVGGKERFQLKARYGAGIKGVVFPWVQDEGIAPSEKAGTSARAKK